MFVLALDTDGSVLAQAQTAASADQVLNLRGVEHKLRLFAGPEDAALLIGALTDLRRTHPEPWCTFLGSGDFHHLSLMLLESLGASTEPFTLVVIDNHPDWFAERPRYHCGNWVAGALTLPFIERVILVGQDSNDLQGIKFHSIPISELASGRLTVCPARRKRSFAPLLWPKIEAQPSTLLPRWWGTEVRFSTLEERSAPAFFDSLAETLRGRRVYLGIDKDCVGRSFLRTDWEQGRLSSANLMAGVRAIANKANIIGVDICGELATTRLRGLWKCLDARRFVWQSPKQAESDAHQRLNLELLNNLSKALT